MVLLNVGEKKVAALVLRILRRQCRHQGPLCATPAQQGLHANIASSIASKANLCLTRLSAAGQSKR